MDLRMDEKILKRIEAKLDILIGILQDGTLTGEEAALLAKADAIVRNGKYQKLLKGVKTR